MVELIAHHQHGTYRNLPDIVLDMKGFDLENSIDRDTAPLAIWEILTSDIYTGFTQTTLAIMDEYGSLFPIEWETSEDGFVLYKLTAC